VGVTGATAQILAQIADATDLSDGDVWVDVPGAQLGIGDIASGATANQWQFINDGLDIIETIGAANITSGQIDYYCIWAPAEVGANLKSAL
jgi:ABC-type nitrate/sulfonate/bicarbonate transport system substrate-binding protein